MIALRWAAASTLAVALLAAAGCTPPPKQEDPILTGPVTPAMDKVTGAQARYNAIPGMVAGIVDAAQDPYAVVSGVDPKAFTTGDVLTFIDVDTNQPVNHGQLVEENPVSSSGRLYVRYDVTGAEARSPRAGDLCVKLKQ
jgi:hypothetical protein